MEVGRETHSQTLGGARMIGTLPSEIREIQGRGEEKAVGVREMENTGRLWPTEATKQDSYGLIETKTVSMRPNESTQV